MLALEETSFAQEKLLERQDLQRLLAGNLAALSPDLMLLSESFRNWENSEREIDLLALAKDSKANFLITCDNDLLILEKFENTVITTLPDFINKHLLQ